MAILFSKVNLTADNGNKAELLCSGVPKSNYDFPKLKISSKLLIPRDKFINWIESHIEE